MRRQEEGFNGLFDFSFQKWTTPWAVRVVYGVGFAIICLGALLQVVAVLAAFATAPRAHVSFWWGEAKVASDSQSTVSAVLLLMLLLVPVMAFLAVLILRLVLEFVLGHYLLGQTDAALAEAPVAAPTDRPLPEGEWRCRCGHVNQAGVPLCEACRRSPNAII